MAEGPVFALVFAGALGSGVVAGVFYAFSTGIMAALRKLPPAQGIAAMQSINLAVINPLFLFAFVGTAALSVGVAIAAFVSWGENGTVAALVGSAAYLLGALVVTGAGNVPMNNALAAVDPASADGGAFWSRYLVRWTAWNHVRTVASLGACAAFIVALTSG